MTVYNQLDFRFQTRITSWYKDMSFDIQIDLGYNRKLLVTTLHQRLESVVQTETQNNMLGSQGGFSLAWKSLRTAVRDPQNYLHFII